MHNNKEIEAEVEGRYITVEPSSSVMVIISVIFLAGVTEENR